MLTVAGFGSLADSTFAVTGDLVVGNFGQGKLQATLGANVTVSGDLFIGDRISNTSGNSVTITGGGSQLTVGSALFNRLYVGYDAVGNNTPGSETTNSLSVANAATASTMSLRVAENTGSKGKMLVSGAGSSFTSSTTAIIGNRGAGSLEISGGANLTNVGEFFVGLDDVGNVLVSGAGSVLQANVTSSANLWVGGEGNNGVGSVTVEKGGRLNTAAHVYLGGSSTSEGMLLVTGPGSHVDSDDGGVDEVTFVGYQNRGTLMIADGASVDSELVRIGEINTVAAGEALATVTGVNGSASTWNVSGNAFVGNLGVGRLEITAGGRMISNTAAAGNSVIGQGASSDGSAVVIDGAGSKWTDAGGLAGPGTDIFIGNGGGSVALPTTLTVQNGGALETGRGVIARLDGSRADVVVTGNGSRWDATGILLGSLSSGSLTVSNGADVNSTGDIILGANVSGAQRGVGVATVSGAGSTLSTNATLTIGNPNTTMGTLNIQDGGAVMNTSYGYIAGFAGSTGTANVGNGSLVISSWTNVASLFVGGGAAAAGGNGTLNVNSRGSVSVANELKLWANGHVVLNGGTAGSLTVQTLTRVAGSTFDFQSGKLAFLNNAGNNRIIDAAALTDIFNADHTITAGKTLQILGPVTLSAPLRVNGGTFALASVKPGNEAAFVANLDWHGGTLEFTGSGLTVGNAGLFGPTLLVDKGKTLVSQTLTIDAGAQLVIAGGLSTGGLTNNGDLVAVGAAVAGPVINNNAVTVVGTVNFNGLVSGPGDFFGPGTANFNGGMAPGASPALVNLEGSAKFAASNALFVQLGGLTPGDEFDVLDIGGSADLGGTLDVSLLGGFTPAAGERFDILTATAVQGTFATKLLPTLTGGLQWFVDYQTSGVSLLVSRAGDFDLDSDVDGADFLTWQRNPSVGSLADWRANFGVSPLVAANAVVPEPASLVMLLAGSGAFLLRRRTAAS